MARRRATRADTTISGAALMARLQHLAQFSETPDGLTRTYLTPALRAAGDQLIGWLAQAGMRAAFDAVGNVVGRYEGTDKNAPALLLGSHYDTVRNAGKYDGPYGIIAAIAVVQALQDAGRRLPFPIEIAAFADEEGVRFRSTLIGSRALAGTLDPKVLDLTDDAGISMREALATFGGKPEAIKNCQTKRDGIRGYIELHIEQGPVLAQERLPVGVVTTFIEDKLRIAHPEWIPLAKLWVLALVVFFAGFALFHKLRRSFADVI